MKEAKIDYYEWLKTASKADVAIFVYNIYQSGYWEAVDGIRGVCGPNKIMELMNSLSEKCIPQKGGQAY